MSYLGPWTKITTKLPKQHQYVIVKREMNDGYGPRIGYYRTTSTGLNLWSMPLDNFIKDHPLMEPTHWRFFANG